MQRRHDLDYSNLVKKNMPVVLLCVEWTVKDFSLTYSPCTIA